MNRPIYRGVYTYPRAISCNESLPRNVALRVSLPDSLPARVVSANSEYGGGDGRESGGNARRSGYHPIYALPALVFFVAGVVAMIRVIWWRAPMWLLLPGWLATVCGGAGVFCAVLWWIVIDGAWVAPLLGLVVLLAALGLIWRGVWHGMVLIRGGRPLYHNAVGIALVIAGMAGLWAGMWLLFAGGPDLAGMAQASLQHLRWEGGEV